MICKKYSKSDTKTYVYSKKESVQKLFGVNGDIYHITNLSHQSIILSMLYHYVLYKLHNTIGKFSCTYNSNLMNTPESTLLTLDDVVWVFIRHQKPHYSTPPPQSTQLIFIVLCTQLSSSSSLKKGENLISSHQIL